MGPPSAAPRGGHRPWQGLLITASLLTFWHPPTTVQFTIEALPSSAAEGKDVLLLACNISETIQAYYWHKGKTAEGSPLIAGYITDIQANIPGAAYSGRETVYPNGSLLFQNITLEDAGSYTLRTINASYDSDQATGQLHVHRPASSVTSGSSRPQPPPLEGPRLSSHPAAHSCLCPQAMVPLTDPPSRPLYPAPEQPLPSMRSGDEDVHIFERPLFCPSLLSRPSSHHRSLQTTHGHLDGFIMTVASVPALTSPAPSRS
ncbi:cell adhesion molecule CEACAM4 isoform X26 [Homo sapiens]|uniref:cell adhesion molecule CEACAM4 isoform X26 n=1 Tax=Homo sapiens TaxID=9606 RepID=UPI0023DFE9CF|nr:carcinoembryonic antigen-related cell adhesion molecule 4 isoform X26 [Homo sapiens]